MDALIPGFYAWFGSLRIRIGGSEAEETYPGTIHRFAGVALVLPGYRIFSTYQGDWGRSRRLPPLPYKSTSSVSATARLQLPSRPMAEGILFV